MGMAMLRGRGKSDLVTVCFCIGGVGWGETIRLPGIYK